MKLNKFALAEKMSLQDIRTIKAGCATSKTAGKECTCAGYDQESGNSEVDG